MERKIFDAAGKLRRNLTIEQLVESGVLVKYLSDRSRAIGVKIPVHLTTDISECPTACTDGVRKIVNAKSSLATGLQLHQSVQVAAAMNIHEDGHILFTDFIGDREVTQQIEAGTIPFPEKDYTDEERENLADVETFISAKGAGASVVSQLFHKLLNIVEDSHIEPRLIELAPGWAYNSLNLLRQIQAAEAPYAEDLDDKAIGVAWVSMFLYYAKYGILYYEEASNRVVKLMLKIDDILDAAIYNMRWSVRAEYTWRIFVRLWKDVFKQLAEDEKALQEFMDAISKSSAAPSSSTGNTRGQQKTGQCSKKGKSSSSRQKVRSAINKAANDEDDEKENSSQSAKPDSEKDENDNSASSSSDNSEDESSSENSGNGNNDNTDNEESDTDNNESENSDGNNGEDERDDENENNNSNDSSSSSENPESNDRHDVEFDRNSRVKGDGKRNSIADHETGRIKDSKGVAERPDTSEADNETDSEADTENSEADADIENLLKAAAEKIAQQQAERELTRQLQNEAQNLPYTPIHQGVSMPLSRAVVSDSMRRSYNAIIGNQDVKTAINTLCRQFEKLLRQPQYCRTKTSGTRLNPRKYKNEDINGRIFHKKAQDTPRVAMGIVIDESGSMSSNNRAYYARIFAIIMQAVCEKLNIPVVVYGHMSSGNDCHLYAYTEFDSVDGEDKYRLTDITSRNGGNRDGAAIYFVASRLAKRPEQVKLLFSMSDGQPASWDYYGEEAEKDIKSITQLFRRKGIITFGAAIGDDKDRIHRCYGDGFLDVTDIRNLPSMIFNIVKAKIKN